MDKYLDHLLEDIRLSYENVAANAAFDMHPVSVYTNDLPDNLQDIPCYPTKKVGEWMNLDPDAFPPADRWEERHLKELCSGLRQLFMEYEYEVVIPWTLPLAEEYTWLVNALSMENVCHAAQEDNSSIVVLQFCENNPASCPFSGFCLNGEEIGCESIDQSKGWEKYL